MLADFTFIIALALGSLKLLDFFLSARQKEALNGATLKLWWRLAEAKNHSLLEWLRRYRWVILVLAVLFFVQLSVWIISKSMWKGRLPGSEAVPGLVVLLVVLSAGALFATKRISWVLSATSLGDALLRTINFVAVAIVPFYLALWTVSLYADTIKNATAQDGSLGHLVFGLFFVAAYVLFTCWTGVVLLCASTIVVPIALLYAASVLLFVSKFVVRRVAEYPNGPLLAAVSLVAIVAAVLKTLT